MPPGLKNSFGQNQAAKQANYARELKAEKNQESLPSSLPDNPLPQPTVQQSNKDQLSDEEQPITHSFPEGQVSEDEEPNVARQLRDKIDQARKEYVQKMVKEAAKQAVKKGWQWLLRSIIVPLLAALGAISWWIWLIILGLIFLAALAIYAKNDPCGFLKDVGPVGLLFMDMIGGTMSWTQCFK